MSSTLILIVLPLVSIVILTVSVWPFVRRWLDQRSEIYQAYLDESLWESITGEDLSRWCFLSAIAGFCLGFLILGGVTIAVLLMVLTYFIPFWIVRFQINSRHHQLEVQLEAGLQNLANSMKAGLTFVMALKDAARNLPDPISEELMFIAKEYELGKSLDEALDHSKRRFRSIHWNLAVLAILVSRQQGGNLSETLERISAFMREVFAIDRKVQVMTSEGRFSAKIVGLSPLFMGAMMYIGAPQTIEPLFTDWIGGGILFIALMLNLIGFFWIEKIVAIEI